MFSFYVFFFVCVWRDIFQHSYLLTANIFSKFIHLTDPWCLLAGINVLTQGVSTALKQSFSWKRSKLRDRCSKRVTLLLTSTQPLRKSRLTEVAKQQTGTYTEVQALQTPPAGTFRVRTHALQRLRVWFHADVAALLRVEGRGGVPVRNTAPAAMPLLTPQTGFAFPNFIPS